MSELLSHATRNDYPKGSVRDFLERLMLQNQEINKQLVAIVMKAVPDDLKASEGYSQELETELLKISADPKLSESPEDMAKRDDVQALIRKIKSGELPENIILGDN